jgi:hypothetical protein
MNFHKEARQMPGLSFLKRCRDLPVPASLCRKRPHEAQLGLSQFRLGTRFIRLAAGRRPARRHQRRRDLAKSDCLQIPPRMFPPSRCQKSTN